MDYEYDIEVGDVEWDMNLEIQSNEMRERDIIQTMRPARQTKKELQFFHKMEMYPKTLRLKMTSHSASRNNLNVAQTDESEWGG